MMGGPNSDPAKAGAYGTLDGVREAAPAYRTSMELSGERTAQILALDTAHADELMMLRDDLADESPAALLRSLAPPRTERPGLVLPKGGTQLRFDLKITDTAARKGASPSGRTPQVGVILEDRFGLPYRALVGPVPADGRPHTVSVPVSAAGGLALTGFELDDKPPVGSAEQHRLSVTALRTAAGDGAEQPVPVPDGFRWQAVSTVNTGGEDVPGPGLEPTVPAGTALSLDYGTGLVAEEDARFVLPTNSIRVTAARSKVPVLNAVATDAFLKASGAKKGQSVDVPLAGEQVRVKIAKVVRQLPTTGPAAAAETSGPTGDGGALLLDLKALTEVFAHDSTSLLAPTEWWLSAGPGDADKVAAQLRALPDTDPAQVHVRDEVAEDLVGDPLGAGPQSALLAVAVVAAALAAVGFAVSAVGSQRERAAEFAVLRALGAPRRRLARMIAAEQGVLITIGLLAGLALGAVLTRAVVPLIVLTGQAAQPVPTVLVQLPVPQVAGLLAGVAALPLLIVAAIALRRADPAVSLRHQGDN